MNPVLLQLAASALVATAGAIELPSFSALRRPASVGAQLGGPCEDGFDDGSRRLLRIWDDDLDADCDNVWDLEELGEELIDDRYSNDRNWRVTSSNSCARQAVNEEIAKIEKRCLDDGPDQCTDLGDTAAELVIRDDWCTPDDDDIGSASITNIPDYKANCKEVATSICKGQIPRVARDWCSRKTMSTSKMLDLQDECEAQVESMVPSGRPSNDKRPCRVDNESPRPYRRNSGRFRFNLMYTDAVCTDDRDRQYQYGQYDDVNKFSDCAEKCVMDGNTDLLEELLGYDWDCEDNTCRCLYNRGALGDQDRDDKEKFTKVNEDNRGKGSISDGKKQNDWTCAKLSGAREERGWEMAQTI